MRIASLAVVLAAAALPTAAALGAGLFCTPVNPGDPVVGTIDGPADKDGFTFPLVKGSRLTLAVKASGGSALRPFFDLYRPDGSKLDISTAIQGEGSNAVSVTDLTVNVTGDWFLQVYGKSGSTGPYGLSIGEGLEKKGTAAPTVPAGSSILHPFSARGGSQVTFTATVKQGPPLVSAVIVDSEGSGIPGAEYRSKGSKISGKKILLGAGPGVYGVRLTGDLLADSTVALKIKVKQARYPRRKVVLGPEPRP